MKTELNDKFYQKLRLTMDSMALLLYCSEFYECSYPPFTLNQWLNFERILKNSQLKRASALLSLGIEAIMINLEIEEEVAMKIVARNQGLAKLMHHLQQLEAMGILVTTKYEEDYPYLLRKKMKRQSPLFLYYSGDIGLLDTHLMCLSGPIRSNRRIDQNTKQVIKKLNEEDYTLMSCANRGVEKLSIKQQLRLGGKVVNFVCSNIITEIKDYIRPIKNGQMLIISAVYPFADFDLVHAIDRNQYAFCLSEVAIIMYSQINSGAVWLTAMQNFKQKWTRLVAIMDDEFYGNARLIELGATGLTMDMIQSRLLLTDLLDQVEENRIEEDNFDQLSIYEFIGE